MIKTMLPVQDLMLKWLRNLRWEKLTVWERDFVDHMWVADQGFTEKQSHKLLEIYHQHRSPKVTDFTEVNIGDYAYIHDFDR